MEISSTHGLIHDWARPIDTASGMAIEVVDDTSAFSKLAPEWKELLAASEMDGLFLTWEWLFTWWKHLALGRELHILTFRRAGVLVALAPFALRHASIRQLPPVPALEFVGSGVAGSDYLDLIVRQRDADDVVKLLSQQLGSAGRTLAFMRVRPNGPAAALVTSLCHDGWRIWRGPVETCPFALLRGLSFDGYLAGLGSEHRYAFRRKLQRIQKRFSASFELVRTEAERGPALETLFDLHATRWRTRGGAGAFATRALKDFHHELTRVALDRGWLRLWLLRLDGVAAAGLYGFLYRHTFYFYQSGFDPAFARDSVGLVLLGTAVRAAIEDGAEELDLLHGTERYKSHWAPASRDLLRCELYAPGARGLLECQATALTRDARRLAGRARETGRRIFDKTAVADRA